MSEVEKNEELEIEVEVEEEEVLEDEVSTEEETEDEVETEEDVETEDEDEGGTEEEDDNTESTGTFTQEEVNEIVRNRLSRKDEEFNKKLDALVSEKLEERKRQESLTDEQREAERLAELSKELEERQRELDFRDRFSEAETGLRQVNIDPRFAQWLVHEDKETTETNIKEFQILFDKAVELRSVNKLRGKTPKANKKPKGNVVSREEFSAMGYRAREELRRKDPELYKELSNK